MPRLRRGIAFPRLARGRGSEGLKAMRESSRAGTAPVERKAGIIPLPVEPRRSRLRYEVIGLGLFALGFLLLANLRAPSGLIGPYLNYALAFLFGTVGSRAIAATLVLLGVVMVFRWHPLDFMRLSLGFGILLWMTLAIWQLAIPVGALAGNSLAVQPGGLFGAGLAAALRPLLGSTVAIVVLSLLGLWSIGYLSETPLVTLFSSTFRVLALFTMATARSIGGLVTARRAPEPPPPIKLPRTRKKQVEMVPEPKPEPEPQLQVVEPEPEPQPEPRTRKPGEYQLPPLSLLSPPPPARQSDKEAIASAEVLEQALASYGIEARVVDVERGPRVTRYEIHLPPGVRVSRVTNLSDDLAYALSALAVRVEAPVPGKGVIGIEVPNSEVTFVHLREILESAAAGRMKSKIAFALGRDISGHPMMGDLATMPHLLIAGATNSGKSVSLNSLIATILCRARPDEVKMLLIDPKRVELSLFEGIPHLAAPVAHDAREAAGLLRWAIREMELRYAQFADLGVRNIAGWNERAKIDQDIEKLHYIVIVIDELADLMMQAATEFETSICRLAQLARATGIHLVVATQRPSVNVITGTIKANIASRIAFAVASQVDSRTILDVNGAERLVGSGDMLYLPLDAPTGKPVRIQGAYVSEKDINAVVGFLKKQAKPEYTPAAVESIGSVQLATKKDKDEGGESDPMFEKALEFVLATKHASASMLQRKFKLGYTRAARLIDLMEEQGYIGPNDGKKPREVFGEPGRTIGRSPSSDFGDDLEADSFDEDGEGDDDRWAEEGE
jgi:S-DNA-T family DNA segregation ATPase FtsK/SpoIIIE